jgi:hypothetical protein
MALKDWKRAKSGESDHYPVVYRKKDDGNYTAVIYYYGFYGKHKYAVRVDDRDIGGANTKSGALKILMNYMRTH